jgi:hypothetical protein
MKTNILIFTFHWCVGLSMLGMMACKETPPDRVRVVETLFEDKFNEPSLWKVSQTDSTGNFILGEATSFVSQGSLELKANQGDGCDRIKAERSWTVDAAMQEKLNTRDTMFLILEIESATTEALGRNTCTFQFHDYNLSLDLQNHEFQTTLEIVLVNWFVHEVYVNGSPEIYHKITASTGIQSTSGATIASNACGADLYAQAHLKLNSFRLEAPYFLYP